MDDLSIKADNLPKSQIFFSYAGRNVLSVIDKQPLIAKDFVMEAYSQDAAKPEASKFDIRFNLSA